MDKWSKPELVVLVRSRPEEAVLQGCKRAGQTVGAGSQFDGCVTVNKGGNCTVNACLENQTS
ncbi:MAG: hypothetical protein OEU97_03980 [Dehalococcoidia bacterium]|nr:hypothetical protein [Dehalococcoidia bacterium]MDH4299246.1 hypothetical protein [Dehalococcoidia bacterium]